MKYFVIAWPKLKKVNTSTLKFVKKHSKPFLREPFFVVHNNLIFDSFAEMIAQKMLKNKVENLRKEILDLNARDEISEDKISEFKSLLNETDNEVRRQQTEEKKLKQHYESRKMELGKLNFGVTFHFPWAVLLIEFFTLR